MKLANYFAAEGASEKYTIEIPKGHYLPVFKPGKPTAEILAGQMESPPSVEDTAQVVPLTLVDALPEATAKHSSARFRNIFLSLLLFASVFAAGILADTLLRHPQTHIRGAVDQLWAPFISQNGETLVIYSNPQFEGNPDDGLKLLTNSQLQAETASPIDETYTGTGEVVAVHDLTNLFDQHEARFTLKRSRLVTWDEAKLRNLIFVGGASQNGALRDLPTTSDFTINLDGRRKGFIANRHPRPGEPTVYAPSSNGEEFALIAMIPGLDPNHRIAIFSGLTTYGTESAIEYACSQDGASALLKQATSGRSVRPFEALLKITISQGVPIKSDLIVLHTH